MTLSFQVTSPAPRDIWVDAIANDPTALPSQSPQWLDSVCAMGRHKEASRLYEFSDGKRFVMPMVRRALPAMVSSAESLPFAWGRGGIVGPGDPTVDHIRAILADLQSLPYARVAVKPNPLTAELWSAAAPPGAVKVPGRVHFLDLEGGFDAVWSKRFTTNTRRQVRKAEKLGVVIERDDTGRLVPVFNALLQSSIDRWAARQHEPRQLARLRGRLRDPIRKFRLIAEHLGEACRIWVAWIEGRPAATILVIQQRNAYYARGAMDLELAGSSGANHFLHKHAIEEACRAGCRFYYMGESGNSESLSYYKERFGAQPCEHAEYFLEKLPFTRIDRAVRGLVKRTIGFRDT